MEDWQLILGVIGLILVLAVGILIWAVRQVGADHRPKKKTWWKRRYDEDGYNRRGYDRDGYNRGGYDTRGYDRSGYDHQGYTIHGRDAHGRYNRLYNVADFAASRYSAEGFLDPRTYPVGMTAHARQRMEERVPGRGTQDPWGLTMDAYCYGKSARQMKPSAAHVVREIEQRHESGIVLLYDGFVYIFFHDNQLITVYRNERIPL